MQNDDDPLAEDGTRPSPRRAEPDAHGQAALLLVESVLHALVDTKTLTLDQAIDAVQIASDVKVELADEIGESETRMRESLALLSAIGLSLKTGRQSAG